MRPLHEAADDEFASVRFVLTDMDETLTFHGRLAATYAALERLQQAGVIVIPVTAAPAGWCDQMARMWPVDGVIGENGGFFFRRGADPHRLDRHFWHEDEAARAAVRRRLAEIGEKACAAVPGAALAEDQPFRLTSLAFGLPESEAERRRIASVFAAEGVDFTVNNLWLLGWFGGYDKLAMARRVLARFWGLDIDRDPDAVLYTGDSANDAPMFAFFRHSVGVSTVTRSLHEIPEPPGWIASGPGGAGFVEAAEAVLRARG